MTENKVTVDNIDSKLCNLEDSCYVWKCKDRNIYLIATDYSLDPNSQITESLKEQHYDNIFIEDSFPLMTFSEYATTIMETKYLQEIIKSENNKIYDIVTKYANDKYPLDISKNSSKINEILLDEGYKLIKKCFSDKSDGNKMINIIPCIKNSKIARERHNSIIKLNEKYEFKKDFYSKISHTIRQLFAKSFYSKQMIFETLICDSIIKYQLMKSDQDTLYHNKKWNEIMSNTLTEWLLDSNNKNKSAICFFSVQHLNPLTEGSILHYLQSNSYLKEKGWRFENKHLKTMSTAELNVMTNIDDIKQHMELIGKLENNDLVETNDVSKNLHETYDVAVKKINQNYLSIISKCWILHTIRYESDEFELLKNKLKNDYISFIKNNANIGYNIEHINTFFDLLN